MPDNASREFILDVIDLAIEEVDVPEWGCSVRVRELTATERNSIGLDVISPDGNTDVSRIPADLHARVACMCIVDEHGERMFQDGDVEAIGRKSANALQRILDVCFRLSGLSAEGADEVKA